MNSKPEEDMNQVYNIIDNYCKKNNANFNYNRFVDAVIKNDNKEIEKTKVYELLIGMLSDNKKRFKEIIPVDTCLFRSRITDAVKDVDKFNTDGENLFGLDKFESKEPPLHISKNGRSNLAGTSYLYVSKDKYTAISECKPLRESYLSVAEFNTVKELKIFNLSDDDLLDELKSYEEEYYSVKHLVELVMRTFYCSVYDIDFGYKVSQYITELVRKHGYDGIAYRSFITNGKNYTIFNCCESNISFVNSEIVQVLAQHLDVVSLNDGKNISNPNTFHLPPEKQIIDFKNFLVDSVKMFKKHEDMEEKDNG